MRRLDWRGGVAGAWLAFSAAAGGVHLVTSCSAAPPAQSCEVATIAAMAASIAACTAAYDRASSAEEIAELDAVCPLLGEAAAALDEGGAAALCAGVGR